MKPLAVLLLLGSPIFAAQTLSLAGEWRFQLGAQDPAQAIPAGEAIFLPGSTDQAGYGNRTAGPEYGRLSRPYTYEGPAWYERDVVIPAAWRGKRITLFLERVHWQSQVWVDGASFGSQDSLSTPHVYDLSRALTPGRHRITLCVDNTYRIDVGRNAHSVTEQTQTNWNGVAGRIALDVCDPVWIDSVELFPERRAVVTVGNATGAPASGTLSANGASVPFTAPGAEQKVELRFPFPNDRWSEFEPRLHNVAISLASGSYRDAWHMQYGVREIATRDGQFTVNGHPTFLRGTVECNIFPLTGYPPTDVESWTRIFRIARSYGLNHFRFHSNCPPGAAFIAADRAGMMLQIELPVWTRFHDGAKTMDFMRAEGYRILKSYGNHPSFTMLGLGNEFASKFDFLDQLVSEFKQADPRRSYTFSANYIGRHDPSPHSDYFIGPATPLGPMRIHGSRFAKTDSSTDYDFSKAIAVTRVPVVAHELGQWVVYPDYSEIASYTGVLKPRNLEAFRGQLAERGMADQAHAFQQASGAFAWLLYKEEIETALRTPHYGGVQLLELEDFPGQGEALVGLLDSLWHSKGILTPEQMCEFFSPTVPLARFPKYTWTSAETFTAKAEVAHYGEHDIPGANATWWLGPDAAHPLASGRFPAANVKTGEVTPLGDIRVPLAAVHAPARLRLEITIPGTAARNHWDIWVYPQSVDTAAPADIAIAHDYAAARPALAAGKKVLLLWPIDRAGASTLPNTFLPVFWSLSWFKQQPGTRGILCDPHYPALAQFPTDPHSNFQWWDVMQPSRTFILDDTPSEFRPIVQVIDDYHRNHKLGAIFETRAGEGRLLVCGFDLESRLGERLAARQLRRSLLAYMEGPDFHPSVELPPGVLEKILDPAPLR